MATAAIYRSNDVEASTKTSFLILDTESIPDGRLLGLVKYAGEGLTPEDAVKRAQTDERDSSRTGSDFLPVSFQIPIAVCVARVGFDYSLQKLTCLDAPRFRSREIVGQFWKGVGRYPKAKLVTFNGRCFDLPLMELAAFRYGCTARDYFSSRNRYSGTSLDLMDWLTNFGACRLNGGLDLLAKLLGKPGKMGMSGDKVYECYLAGKLQEINDYCMFDTLDTYFTFLRTRVVTGDLTLEEEETCVRRAKRWLTDQLGDFPALQIYLDRWADWTPWP